MKKAVFLAFSVLVVPLIAAAQPRPADKTAGVPDNLPPSFEARYESGIFGAVKKEKGSLKFDDANSRVVFYRSDNKELFSIPYDSLVMIYPDHKESITQTGNVMSRMPVPGAPLFGLMTTNARYLMINYDDQDVDAQGTASFRLKNQEQLRTFIAALGAKAKLMQKGDAFYRPKKKY
jgi:hypothetical protein